MTKKLNLKRKQRSLEMQKAVKDWKAPKASNPWNRVSGGLRSGS